MNKLFSTEAVQQLKYFVERTSLGKALPVYTDFKNDGRKYTLIRKISGDIDILADEISELLELKDKTKYLKVRADLGHIKITGQYDLKVREFLTKKGF